MVVKVLLVICLIHSTCSERDGTTYAWLKLGTWMSEQRLNGSLMARKAVDIFCCVPFYQEMAQLIVGTGCFCEHQKHE